MSWGNFLIWVLSQITFDRETFFSACNCCRVKTPGFSHQNLQWYLQKQLIVSFKALDAVYFPKWKSGQDESQFRSTLIHQAIGTTLWKEVSPGVTSATLICWYTASPGCWDTVTDPPPFCTLRANVTSSRVCCRTPMAWSWCSSDTWVCMAGL